MFNREDIEDIILSMADIVMENRYLRHELEKAREYEKKYRELLAEDVKNANESTAMLLKACLMGAFNVGGNANESIRNP